MHVYPVTHLICNLYSQRLQRQAVLPRAHPLAANHALRVLEARATAVPEVEPIGPQAASRTCQPTLTSLSRTTGAA